MILVLYATVIYDYDVLLQPLFKVQAHHQSIASLTTAQYNDLLTYFNDKEMKVSVLCQQSVYFYIDVQCFFKVARHTNLLLAKSMT